MGRNLRQDVFRVVLPFVHRLSHSGKKRYDRGWGGVMINKIEELVLRVEKSKAVTGIVLIVYLGDIVEVLEQFYENGIRIKMGSDQTSLQNPWSEGYYPADLTFD